MMQYRRLVVSFLQRKRQPSKRLLNCSVNEKEIERKFYPSKELSKLFESTAHSITSKIFTDIYYDTVDHKLTTRDIWLRKRDQIYELKFPFKEQTTNVEKVAGVDRYNEITDSNKIVQTLVDVPNTAFIKPSENSFEFFLSVNKIKLFANIRTYRTRYMIKVDIGQNLMVDINVDYDKVEYICNEKNKVIGNYEIAEIELVSTAAAENNNMSQSSDDVMSKILQKFGINTKTTVRGKVLEYLFIHKPEHYKALEKSGLIANKLGNNNSSEMNHTSNQTNDKLGSNRSSDKSQSQSFQTTNELNNETLQLLNKSAVNIFYLRKCNYACK